MIRHHVLIVLNNDAKAVADQIVAELAAYAPTCAHIRSYQVGRDAGITEGAADVAVVAEFDDVAGYRAYATDQDHVDIINRLIAPNAAQLLRCQTQI
jgi:hypothetical protein